MIPGEIAKIYRVMCHDCEKVEEFSNADVPEYMEEVVYLLINKKWTFFKIDGWHCPECIKKEYDERKIDKSLVYSVW